MTTLMVVQVVDKIVSSGRTISVLGWVRLMKSES